jgi:hypothetical protein
MSLGEMDADIIEDNVADTTEDTSPPIERPFEDGYSYISHLLYECDISCRGMCNGDNNLYTADEYRLSDHNLSILNSLVCCYDNATHELGKLAFKICVGYTKNLMYGEPYDRLDADLTEFKNGESSRMYYCYSVIIEHFVPYSSFILRPL